MQKGATLPALGLSNQVDVETAASATTVSQSDVTDATTTTPPTEETLMQSTLWPETQKLYGHGYEVYSLCATSDGRLLASACKATNAEHAQIIVWNTQTWRQHQQLAAHQLTITQMRFSPDDRYLLSVSRDRRWTVFERSANAEQGERFGDASLLAEYTLLETTNKQNGIHGRIIWTCDWSPDSQYFATGSRDGKCVMWHAIDERHRPNSNVDKTSATLQHFTAVDVLSLGTSADDSVTSLAFAGHLLSNGYLIAVGTDAGTIRICRFSEMAWHVMHLLDNSQAHHSTVRRLAFRPHVSGDAEDEFYLASCGNDHFVRVYAITQ